MTTGEGLKSILLSNHRLGQRETKKQKGGAAGESSTDVYGRRML